MLAGSRPKAAVIEVDDVRHMVVGGHLAPWEGDEGAEQQLLGVRSACMLAGNFSTWGFEVVIADVVSPETLPLYRQWLPTAFVVRLHVSIREARRRAQTRAVYLMDHEFAQLHSEDARRPPAADEHLEVSSFSTEEQVAAVARLWELSSQGK
jgi:hypothetical protein